MRNRIIYLLLCLLFAGLLASCSQSITGPVNQTDENDTTIQKQDKEHGFVPEYVPSVDSDKS